MPAIVYRNTGKITFFAFPASPKQKPLIHRLVAPFYTLLYPFSLFILPPIAKNACF